MGLHVALGVLRSLQVGPGGEIITHRALLRGLHGLNYLAPPLLDPAFKRALVVRVVGVGRAGPTGQMWRRCSQAMAAAPIAAGPCCDVAARASAESAASAMDIAKPSVRHSRADSTKISSSTGWEPIPALMETSSPSPFPPGGPEPLAQRAAARLTARPSTKRPPRSYPRELKVTQPRCPKRSAAPTRQHRQGLVQVREHQPPIRV
jgi:hypothetical protein